MKTLNEQLRDIKVVPVIAIKDANKAVKLAEVLIENGLPCAEVTFRTEQAALAMKNMREAFPDMLIGAGTVLTTAQVDQAIEAGVDFVVSPGFNPTTVKYCQQRGVTIVPGVNNPSLVEQAMEMGLDTLKFFPAEPSGGVAMLKALTAVYPVSFMPTGGVSPSNVKNYLAIPAVLACGGTWMVPNDLIDNEKWDELAVLVKEVAGIIA
ncbi:bifunctional 4-hydroxy-2-oxoglutarate aldolase/2-dehydro-3-deoxy-phosphogluconate aldolase [Vibrio fluvialis]|jgi:2-dehydro-3-deoxyphosphogluconate aldolase/(4S)-4-hydroxy-2-oxoglutarate aldolase|uniref:2-dehydro-3-deoxy-phosphogluconate aldolase n=2 Tax=Vibrio fluvialis TaxID=676 RepID=A0AAX2LUV4_VIBFL|nr:MULTISPECIES: bifunctional 4-hydroxy-2-oxoglutarate aldolase/2-dehydro-3-deoxy-phosphogluconate aldolase [Vibrio]HDM8033691.1 bifunctional 4-hydroxy-2-oxoglutarate aldolase/2-dehydro-3-deoxy-phosphogluconate aldolase [Vibrio fluvialis clinical-1]AMF92098.1 ketohydroxyglutarate aldolase [Vibrio fluvialis]EKO3367121.1 bifunctional 4-hydroxy-2-oxoglutarate aldolase/2-dehydro-3-deoxy-phosphogluconate aldolase [Vibrio fluvialis]EKO3377965.1 bifunctional 4-hydroxy-2-oxoglutarate aldolase/2-dehydro